MGKEKKEIWKLLELLNECKPTVNCANFKEHYEFIDDDIYLIREWMDGEEEQFPMYVCYKKGEFIKWLVENDKIDLQKVIEQNKNWYDITRRNPDDNFIDNAIEYDDELDLFLLMLLSIQDSPIEFLTSIIK